MNVARWEIIDRTYLNPTWDLLWIRIHYQRPIVNRYRVYKHEKRVPYAELRDRKYGPSMPDDGGRWRER